LWIIDSGQVNGKQLCHPKLLAFDLVTDELVHSFIFPMRIYKAGLSVFTDMTVDLPELFGQEDCENTMIYIADPWGYGLIVYDQKNGKAWRIEHYLMQPDADLQKINFANHGIFSVSITPRTMNSSKINLV